MQRTFKTYLTPFTGIALWMMAPLLVLAQQTSILVGQTAGFTGSVAAGVKETTEGAKLWIDAVNAKGGVNGQRIELISLDDKFDPKLAAENARVLIEERKVSVMLLNRGTPHTEAVLPLLAKNKISLVAPSTGAMVFHRPVQEYVFNVRPTYQREAAKAVTHLHQLGLSRIGVIHTDDTFGQDALTGAENGFASVELNPIFVEKFDRAKPNFGPIATKAFASKAQAIVFIGSGTAVTDGVRALRAVGSAAQIVTLSNNASTGLVRQMGEYARGLIVTQVMPYERSIAYPMVREALELAKAKGLNGVSPAMLEGFAGAKVLVEALRRAGRNPSRSKITDSLEAMRKFDLGGIEIGYSQDDHSGMEFVELSVVDSTGQFKR
jgi:ABC-type branched-subunit amino acid transport system substrate-binding protein